VISCDRGAAAPDVQAVVQSATSKAAVILVKQPSSRGRSGLYGTATPSEGAVTRFGGGDDN